MYVRRASQITPWLLKCVLITFGSVIRSVHLQSFSSVWDLDFHNEVQKYIYLKLELWTTELSAGPFSPLCSWYASGVKDTNNVTVLAHCLDTSVCAVEFQLQSTLCGLQLNLSQILIWTLLHKPLETAATPVASALFSAMLFLSTQLLITFFNISA